MAFAGKSDRRLPGQDRASSPLAGSPLGRAGVRIRPIHCIPLLHAVSPPFTAVCWAYAGHFTLRYKLPFDTQQPVSLWQRHSKCCISYQHSQVSAGHILPSCRSYPPPVVARSLLTTIYYTTYCPRLQDYFSNKLANPQFRKQFDC